MKRRNKLVAVSAGVVLAFASGCSTPKVTYHKNVSLDSSDAYIRFALQGAKVVIAEPEEEKPAAPAGGGKPEAKAASTVEGAVRRVGLANSKTIATLDELKKTKATVAVSEAKGTLHFMEPQENWFYKTNLKVGYFDGTKVPKTIGAEFEDNTLKVIESIGGLAVVMAPLLLVADVETPKKDEIQLPIILDFTNPKAFDQTSSNQGKWLRLDSPEAAESCAQTKDCYWWYKFQIKDAEKLTDSSTTNPDGAVLSATFFDKDEKTSRYIPFSACNEVEISITKTDGTEPAIDPLQKHTFVEKIPNPTRVDFLPLPKKGTITLHEKCGADIANEKVDTADAYEILEAIGKQASAVYTAIKKEKQPASAAKETK